jgi:carbon starvation protein CstA
MFILITTLLLMATALMLVLLLVIRPEYRFAWLTAVGAVFLAWITVIFWLPQLPLSITLPSWSPTDLFSTPPVFLADGLSWPYALSLVTLAIAILLTASAREGFPDYYGWAVS